MRRWKTTDRNQRVRMHTIYTAKTPAGKSENGPCGKAVYFQPNLTATGELLQYVTRKDRQILTIASGVFPDRFSTGLPLRLKCRYVLRFVLTLRISFRQGPRQGLGQGLRQGFRQENPSTLSKTLKPTAGPFHLRPRGGLYPEPSESNGDPLHGARTGVNIGGPQNLGPRFRPGDRRTSRNLATTKRPTDVTMRATEMRLVPHRSFCAAFPLLGRTVRPSSL